MRQRCLSEAQTGALEGPKEPNTSPVQPKRALGSQTRTQEPLNLVGDGTESPSKAQLREEENTERSEPALNKGHKYEREEQSHRSRQTETQCLRS